MGRLLKPGGPRKYVTVYIPVRLREYARVKNLNMSEILETELQNRYRAQLLKEA
jgi:post-segregation antitoxin (ccd killing protein)